MYLHVVAIIKMNKCHSVNMPQKKCKASNTGYLGNPWRCEAATPCTFLRYSSANCSQQKCKQGVHYDWEGTEIIHLKLKNEFKGMYYLLTRTRFKLLLHQQFNLVIYAYLFRYIPISCMKDRRPEPSIDRN